MNPLTKEKKLERAQRDEKIVKMRLAGYKVREIAALYKITSVRVSQIFKTAEQKAESSKGSLPVSKEE